NGQPVRRETGKKPMPHLAPGAHRRRMVRGSAAGDAAPHELLDLLKLGEAACSRAQPAEFAVEAHGNDPARCVRHCAIAQPPMMGQAPPGARTNCDGPMELGALAHWPRRAYAACSRFGTASESRASGPPGDDSFPRKRARRGARMNEHEKTLKAAQQVQLL